MTSIVDVLTAISRMTLSEAEQVYDVMNELWPRLANGDKLPAVPHQTSDEMQREFDKKCNDRLIAAMEAAAKKRQERCAAKQ
jgi:hypothetical protein